MPLGPREYMRSIAAREYTRRWRVAEKEVGFPWKKERVYVAQVEIRTIYIHMFTKEPYGEALEWRDATTGDLLALGLGDMISVSQTSKVTIDH